LKNLKKHENHVSKVFIAFKRLNVSVPWDIDLKFKFALGQKQYTSMLTILRRRIHYNPVSK